MASRASVKWHWRDLRVVYVLLVWAAFAASLFFYFDGTILPDRAAAVAPPSSTVSNDEVYTGSIIVMSPYGDNCWQMRLDNRTGMMWGYSEVDCGALNQMLAQREQRGLTNKTRINTISNAFRGFGK